jgi:type VI protein secretion system component Hcp
MIKNACLSLAVTTALIAGVAQADNYLIQVPGIEGTSNLVGFEAYIPIEYFSLGFTRGTCQDLNFVKAMDAASPNLTGAAMLGTAFQSIVLVGLQAGEARSVRMRLTLIDSVFTSVSTSGISGSDFQPRDQVSLQPSSVTIESFEQDIQGQSVLVATNTVVCQTPPIARR